MTPDLRKPPALAEQYDPFGAHAQDPYTFFARARSTEPVFHSPRFGMWFVTRYEDIVAVLRDPEAFSSADAIPTGRQHPPEVREILGDWAEPMVHTLIADPPAHTRLRRLSRDAFAPSRIAALAPLVGQVADDLIDQMGAGPADLISRFAYPLPLTVILRVLGVPLEDLQWCYRWTQDLVAWLGPVDVSLERHLEIARSYVAIREYVKELARLRAREPADDLISSLVTARVPGVDPLSVENREAIAVIIALIIAGHETTANLIGNLVWRLLSNPVQLAEVERDPELVSGAVEETLRYDPSGIGFIRTATRDVMLGGVPIPAGGRLMLLYASGNHDPEAFPDPERYQVRRDSAVQHLGFGRGIHYCLGAPLARLEGQIALERLLARLPGLRLADPDHQPRWKRSLIVRGLESLHIAWG